MLFKAVFAVQEYGNYHNSMYGYVDGWYDIHKDEVLYLESKDGKTAREEAKEQERRTTRQRTLLAKLFRVVREEKLELVQ